MNGPAGVVLLLIAGLVDVQAQARAAGPTDSGTLLSILLVVIGALMIGSVALMIFQSASADRYFRFRNKTLHLLHRLVRYASTLWHSVESRHGKPVERLGLFDHEEAEPTPIRIAPTLLDLSTEATRAQEKIRSLRYAQLPVSTFLGLSSPTFQPLDSSSDPGLTAAEEIAFDETEEDEAVRALAIRVLSRFRNSNSVEALSQFALYDLSARLRASALAALAAFDHQSVFETILLGCTDPSWDVRSASTRSLYHLGFDWADVWESVGQSEDEFRISRAARAAIQTGLVSRAFDRIISEDPKTAYEAFAFTCVLVRSGESVEIFDAIEGHRDPCVRMALLHTVKAATCKSIQDLHESADPNPAEYRFSVRTESDSGSSRPSERSQRSQSTAAHRRF